MKRIFIIASLVLLGATVSAQEAEVPAEEPVAEEAVAEEAAGFKVTYLENDCLAEVPTDENAYAAGDEVTVLFEPVQYKDYLVFYGWDIDDDGWADFGYNFDKFTMPEEDVELKAICIGVSWGSSCPGCHLHGKPGSYTLDTFTPGFSGRPD